MKNNDNQKILLLSYRNFLISFFSTFLLLGITQIVFYLYNSSYFNIKHESILNIILGNLVFILATCSMFLAPFIICSVCPILSFIKFRFDIVKYLKMIFWIIPTFTILIINLIDVFWYQTIGERSSWQHVDTFLSLADKLGFTLACLKTYWPALLITICSTVGFIYFLNYLDKSIKRKNYTYRITKKSILEEFILLAIVLICCIYSIRGLGKSPLRAIEASKFVDLKNMDVVLNTPYILIKTVGKDVIHRLDFYDQEELSSIFNPEKSFPTRQDSKDPDSLCLKKYSPSIKNIVLIQMESMAAEYLSTFNKQTSYAPFIDSLIQKSITYHGWANGRQTKEAPISVAASFPNLVPIGGNRNLLASNHFHTKFHSLAEEFKKLSYDTLFFFGDDNGSNYVDTFALNVGFENYYGKKEYNAAFPGNKDFMEGSLGIVDEPFLQYTLSIIDSTYKEHQKPFLSYIVTTTAHFPFLIPEKYEKSLPAGPLPILKPLRYSDIALEKFFNEASKKPWYQETLFVLFADHTSMSQGGVWATDKGKRQIPIIFFIPSLSKDCMMVSPKIAQQIDIFPTIIDMFGINTKMVTYGDSLLDSKHINLGLYNDGKTHLINVDNYLVKCINNCQKVEIFDTDKDPFTKSDLTNDPNTNESEKKKLDEFTRFSKAIIQQFTNRILDKKTTID